MFYVYYTDNRVCTYGGGVYLGKEFVLMEGGCTCGRDVYLWKGCVPREGVCTYGGGVYLWKVCTYALC